MQGIYFLSLTFSQLMLKISPSSFKKVCHGFRILYLLHWETPRTLVSPYIICDTRKSDFHAAQYRLLGYHVNKCYTSRFYQFVFLNSIFEKY